MGYFNPILYFIKSFIRIFTKKFFWVIIFLLLVLFFWLFFNRDVKAYSNDYQVLEYISCSPWNAYYPNTQQSFFVSNLQFKSSYRVVMKYKIGTLNVQHLNLSLFGSLNSSSYGNYLTYWNNKFYTQNGATSYSTFDGDLLYIDYNNNGKVIINNQVVGDVTCVDDTNPFYINYRYFNLSSYDSFPCNRRFLLSYDL